MARARRSPTRFGRLPRRSKTTSFRPIRSLEETISEHLYTADMPDPDLLIRTAGENAGEQLSPVADQLRRRGRQSCAWPDFSEENLHGAITEFASRNRRFGRARSHQHAAMNPPPQMKITPARRVSSTPFRSSDPGWCLKSPATARKAAHGGFFESELFALAQRLDNAEGRDVIVFGVKGRTRHPEARSSIPASCRAHRSCSWRPLGSRRSTSTEPMRRRSLQFGDQG